MIKYILLVTFTLTLSASYEPKKVTASNLKKLNALDAKLYNLAVKKEDYNCTKVASFIYKNLVYKLDYTLLKVVGSASARGTFQDETQNQFTNEGNRARAEVKLTYPFFDAKESNERVAKMMATKQKIITQVKKYFTIKAQYKDLKIEKLILMQVETRAKARKLQAVGSFDDWLKVIRDIKKVNTDLSLSEIELSENKQLLLSYVKESKRYLLEKML